MRRLPPSVQLQLDFSVPAPVRAMSPEHFLQAMRQRRVRYLQQIRFKTNRARIITLGRDGTTLHVHACFRQADDRVLDAVAVFLNAGRRSQAYRDAVRQMREFWTRRGQVEGWGHEEDAAVVASVRALPCSGTAQQRAFRARISPARSSGLSGHSRHFADARGIRSARSRARARRRG